jgi:CheY-like chemotaxis protein
MNAARRKILCIGGGLEVEELLADELTDMGYAVSRANDGDQGFAAILRDEPDLVLCDVSMPGPARRKALYVPLCHHGKVVGSVAARAGCARGVGRGPET